MPTARIDATRPLRRSDFGMTYDVEGGCVGDEIRFVIGLEAIRQEQRSAGRD